MNGEFLELYNMIDNRLRDIETVQTSRHLENIKKFGNLKCDVHVERMAGIQRWIIGLCSWSGMITMVIVYIHIYGK